MARCTAQYSKFPLTQMMLADLTPRLDILDRMSSLTRRQGDTDSSHDGLKSCIKAFVDDIGTLCDQLEGMHAEFKRYEGPTMNHHLDVYGQLSSLLRTCANVWAYDIEQVLSKGA